MSEKLKYNLDTFSIKDHSFDYKINALNILATVSLGEYLQIAKVIRDNNELQRRPVASNSTVYSLLKEDILAGCQIPAIVLAIDDADSKSFEFPEKSYSEITEHIKDKSSALKLLDGLQRTNILLELEATLTATDELRSSNKEVLQTLYGRPIRLEIYINISNFGILYRMLTLNTGQTPMSLRHQIEILYSSYYIKETNGITLLRDAFDKTKLTKIGQYKFSDIVEGVTSFIDGSEFPLERFDLLSYIKTLKKLSAEKEQGDMFVDFLNAYHELLGTMITKSQNWHFNYEQLTSENLSYFPVTKTDQEVKNFYTSPFGFNAEQIFLKSQVFTGFGAALNGLKSKGIINSINEIHDMFPKIEFNGSSKEAYDLIIVRLEQIRKDSRKIGESQRTFFKHFFTSLFNLHDEDNCFKFEPAVESAFRKTA